MKDKIEQIQSFKDIIFDNAFQLRNEHDTNDVILMIAKSELPGMLVSCIFPEDNSNDFIINVKYLDSIKKLRHVKLTYTTRGTEFSVLMRTES